MVVIQTTKKQTRMNRIARFLDVVAHMLMLVLAPLPPTLPILLVPPAPTPTPTPLRGEESNSMPAAAADDEGRTVKGGTDPDDDSVDTLRTCIPPTAAPP
mmetsp:Transcript_8540/g.19307  ORF Transcript_8540/g.19307 Transcript_8540/m.19307 type:complete len:100 (+) Transcript_8540:208-507(+)